MASYAAPSDMTLRYDARRLGDLVNDDGTRATAVQLTTNAVLLAHLQDASGMIDAACQRGQRYSPTDLTTLTGNSLSLLVRLTCDICYGLMVARRAYNAADTAAQAPRYVEALRQLQNLENGEWIFTTQGALAAGVPLPNQQLSSQIPLLSSIYRYFGVLTPYPFVNFPQFSSFDRQ